MKISSICEKKTTISLEVFPPKKVDEDLEKLYQTIDELSVLKPDFISVTYGAGGSTVRNTIKIASRIKEVNGIEPLAHLTCISSTKADVLKVCNDLKAMGVENIMSLRGDEPLEKDPNFVKELHYASELNEFIKDNFHDDFCLGGGCYPEGHPEAKSLDDDLINLKKKVDCGAEFLITQIIFNNDFYYDLKKRALEMGINVPIIAGIMPVINGKQIMRMTSLCGSTVPDTLKTMIARFEDDKEAMMEIGISYATNQIIDLLANGVDGIHIYTMNNSNVALRIFKNLENVLKKVMRDNEK